MREARNLDFVGRLLPIAVRGDDDRRVIAELETNVLARSALLNAPAHLWRTGERDQGDVVVIDDGITHHRSRACHHRQV